MKVQQTNEENKREFFIEDNGKRLAELTYKFEGDKQFIIDHTEVFAGNEGKGLGKQLLKAAVDFARENTFKIIPTCSYAKSVFAKTSDYKDVLY